MIVPIVIINVMADIFYLLLKESFLLGKRFFAIKKRKDKHGIRNTLIPQYIYSNNNFGLNCGRRLNSQQPLP